MSLGGKCHDQVGAVLQEFHTQAVPKTRTASWTTVGPSGRSFEGPAPNLIVFDWLD